METNFSSEMSSVYHHNENSNLGKFQTNEKGPLGYQSSNAASIRSDQGYLEKCDQYSMCEQMRSLCNKTEELDQNVLVAN